MGCIREACAANARDDPGMTLPQLKELLHPMTIPTSRTELHKDYVKLFENQLKSVVQVGGAGATAALEGCPPLGIALMSCGKTHHVGTQ